MLRALVLFLVLANAGYYAWSHGWLDGVAGNSQGDREPQRLSNQVRPEIVRILPPSAATSGAGGAGGGSNNGNSGTSRSGGAGNEPGGAASAPAQTSAIGTPAFTPGDGRPNALAG